MANWNGFLLKGKLQEGTWSPGRKAPVRYNGQGINQRPSLLYPATSTLLSTLTDLGRANTARAIKDGMSFTVNTFAVGTGGYYANMPTQATPIDTSQQTLINEVWRKPIALITNPSTVSVAFFCHLDFIEAHFGLGELGLFATIVNSPLVPSEVGTQFLYAVCHFPLMSKHDRAVAAYRVTVAP